jgi:hypothetical protein
VCLIMWVKCEKAGFIPERLSTRQDKGEIDEN